MASTLAWQKATDYAALAAAHRVEGDMTAAGGPSSVDVRALVEFTKARAEADLSDMGRLERVAAGIQNLDADLATMRAAGTIITAGTVQERLRGILAWAEEA